MKVLVVGGMHGNEPLGKEVVQLFKAAPVANVDVIMANEKAIEQNCRFVDFDLNRSFPGKEKSKIYERRRAAELLQLAKKYDLVLDFHNTHCPGNDCSFVGELAPSQLMDVSAWLGLDRVVVADYDCINKYALNCLSIEISLNSPRMDASDWFEKIVRLSQQKSVPRVKVQTYRFAYRMTLEDKARLKLGAQNLRAFIAIKPSLAKAMGVASPAYPIFIDDAYTPYNFGGLLNLLG